MPSSIDGQDIHGLASAGDEVDADFTSEAPDRRPLLEAASGSLAKDEAERAEVDGNGSTWHVETGLAGHGSTSVASEGEEVSLA